MTCVAGLVDNGKVYMIGDSMSMDAWYNCNVANQDKVFIVGDFIYGISGSWRIRDIMQHVFEAPIHDDGISDQQYMKTKYIKALIECFEDNDFKKIKDSVASVDGGLLIGYKGILYNLNPDFALLSCSDYGESSGAGRSGANAALYALKDIIKDPENRLLKVMEATEATNGAVRSPFKILVK